MPKPPTVVIPISNTHTFIADIAREKSSLTAEGSHDSQSDISGPPSDNTGITHDSQSDISGPPSDNTGSTHDNQSDISGPPSDNTGNTHDNQSDISGPPSDNEQIRTSEQLELEKEKLQGFW